MYLSARGLRWREALDGLVRNVLRGHDRVAELARQLHRRREACPEEPHHRAALLGALRGVRARDCLWDEVQEARLVGREGVTAVAREPHGHALGVHAPRRRRHAHEPRRSEQHRPAQREVAELAHGVRGRGGEAAHEAGAAYGHGGPTGVGSHRGVDAEDAQQRRLLLLGGAAPTDAGHEKERSEEPARARRARGDARARCKRPGEGAWRKAPERDRLRAWKCRGREREHGCQGEKRNKDCKKGGKEQGAGGSEGAKYDAYGAAGAGIG